MRAGGVAEVLDSPSIRTSNPGIGVRSIAIRTATGMNSGGGLGSEAPSVGVGVGVEVGVALGSEVGVQLGV